MSKEKRRVPKLRFPGFTEDWEQCKLSVLATMNARIGWQNLRTSEFLDNGDYLLITGTDFDNGRIKYSTCHYVEKKRFDQDTKIQLSTGSILITKDGTLGKVALVEELPKPATLNAGVFNVRVKDDAFLSYKYLYHYLKAPFLMKYVTANATGGTIKHLNQSILVDFPIPITGKQEQDRIAKLLDSLESIITLHQRKLNNLKLKKKALLQKLFPKNEERYPELRFPGFTDAWEQRKLSQITVRVTRKNGNQSDLPLTISAQDGLVDQRKYFNRQVASRDMSNYYLIKKGEFAYNKSYSEGYPFGAVKRLDYYDIGVLSTLYILFEITDKNISSDFLVSYYMTHLWYKEVSKRAAEGARNHGLLNISTEDFFNSELNIPNSIEEQVKIGNLIKQFDKFITLHQRKLDHLQLQKKALLQQMFV